MKLLGGIIVLASGIMLTLQACTKKEQISEPVIHESTKEMIQELKEISLKRDNIQTWHLNRERAMVLDEQLKTIKEPGRYISLMFKSGVEWLNSGDYNRAISRLNSVLSYIQENKLNIPENALHSITEVLGISYLRQAEIENCVNNHNEYSCLLPIEKEGQHTEREGGENALKVFESILTKRPDIQTMWLYNIAQMTLGAYPDGIEDKYLIDPSVFESDITFPRFKEIGTSVGVGVNDISGSVVMDDFDNDGYLDLMVSSYGLDDQIRYFRNDTKGGYIDNTFAAGLVGLYSGLNMVQADYNNDGWVDILILRGAWLGKEGKHPNSLLKNNGDGTFRDVTKESGLYCHFPTQTASWADYNNDGWIDLFIGNEYSKNTNAPAQLFENNGDGTFTNVAQSKGLDVKAFIKGCSWGDYNNDGLPDLYLSCINGNNFLFKNGGPSNNYEFTNVSLSAGTQNPQMSFPCWFFDYNQDGWEDIFVSGFDFSQFETAAGEVARNYLDQAVSAELPRLYKNNKDGTFTDVSAITHVNKVLFTMGCNFGDLNNDGYPDFYTATGTPDFRALIPNRMFLNNSGIIFWDVTKAGGFGHLQKGHGVAFGDLDNDGDQDIYTVLGGSYDGDNFMNALFMNPGFNNNWIKLRLQGTTANKSAIGARVKVYVKNESGAERIFYSTVSSGASFGANPLRIEQGLSNYNQIEKIEVTWPGDTHPQVYDEISIGTYLLLIQGVDQPKQINISPFKFKENHSGHEHIHS